MQKSPSFFSVAVMNKNSLRKGNHSPQLEGLCKSETTSQIVPKSYEKTAQVQKESSISSDNHMELVGSHALPQTETAWQDSHKGRRGRVPVISTGPDLVGGVRRWYQAIW